MRYVGRMLSGGFIRSYDHNIKQKLPVGQPLTNVMKPGQQNLRVIPTLRAGFSYSLILIL